MQNDLSPGTVDDSILRIERAYDDVGRLATLSSFDAATGGDVVNQIAYEYDGWGNVSASQQAHDGAVSTGTPAVEYAYADGAVDGQAKYVRLSSMTYPNGRILRYEYSSGLDDSISRLSLLADDSGGSVGTHLEEYSYLGLGTIVKLAHPETGFDLSYIKRTGESDGDAGDQYTGLDRFGQITDQRWMDSSGNASDRFQYGYDRDGNPLYKNNLLSSANSELYHADGAANGYDPLNRLTDFQRGTLSDANSDGIPDTVTTATRSQTWDLDALGNWDGINTDGTNESRTHNKQNQLTQKGSATLAFDNNGNTTTDENGRTLVYDAWNHLMAYKNGQSTLSAYAYDALSRRILENGATARHLYYTAQWQVIEERLGGVCRVQQVWSPIYVDALLLRDRDSDSNGSLEERLYAQRDANFNITALMGVDGLVKLRVVYDPYGLASFLTSAWASGSDSYQLQYRHQGGRWDGTSGLYYFRNRDLSATLGRWMEEDLLGWVDGANLYGYERIAPVAASDPSGLFELDDHESITRIGLRRAGLRFQQSWHLDRIQSANARVDTMEFLNDSLHAQNDGFIGVLHDLMVDIKNEQCKDYMLEDGANSVLRPIGRALHVLQDFYTHTDWIDGGTPALLDLYRRNGDQELYQRGTTHITHPSTLRLDWIELGSTREIKNVEFYGGVGGFISDVFGDPHNKYNADGENCGRTYRKVNKSWIGVPKAYSRAKDRAKDQTGGFLTWAQAHMSACCRLKLFGSTD